MKTNFEIGDRLAGMVSQMAERGEVESDHAQAWIGCLKALGDGTRVYPGKTFDRLLDEYSEALKTIQALKLEIEIFQGLEELQRELPRVGNKDFHTEKTEITK